MEIRDGQKLFFPLADPPRALRTLAAWTMPIPARIVTDFFIGAPRCRAADEMSAKSGRVTTFNGVEHLMRRIGKPMLAPKGSAVFQDNILKGR